MRSTVGTGAMPNGAAGPSFDRDAAVTRSLLGYGAVAGPLYLAVGLVQAALREGFDPLRHPLSLLANGPGGWVQTINFVVTGLMVIAAAVGFRRVLRPAGRTASWLLGGFGASMIAAAVFPADPVDGFPAGTPAGPPASISTAGLLHFAAGALGFTFLALSCLLAARPVGLIGRWLGRLSLLSGIAVALGFYGGIFGAFSPGTLGIWFSVLVGWTWLAAVSVHLYRVAPNPNCPPARRASTGDPPAG